MSDQSKEELEDYLERQHEFFLWVKQSDEKLSSHSQLPSWFDINQYLPVKKYNLKQWLEAMYIRQELECIVADGPVFSDSDVVIKFLNHLLEDPLNPKLSLWPSVTGMLEEEVKCTNEWLTSGNNSWISSSSSSCSFDFSLDLPDKMLIDGFKRVLNKSRQQKQLKPNRIKKADYKKWGELNMLALVDLRLWAQKEKKHLSWDLIVQICDPKADKDESSIRRQVNSFFDDFYYEGSARLFLLTQSILEE